MADKYFVYVKGLKGPQPQIWYGKPTDGNGGSTDKPLFEHKLNDDELELSLDDLILKFKDVALNAID